MSGEVPASVQRTHEFLEERGVWHMTTENANGREVHSCREAADSRDRLGERGIPLWDELKTLAFDIGADEASEPVIVMAHCRGDRQFDLDAIAGATDVKTENLRRLEDADLKRLGMGYGLVNPFQDLKKTVTHLFDSDTLERIGIPGTVMTNAGDRSWGVELKAQDLLNALSNARVADIATIDPEEGERPQWAVNPQHVGIITGNPFESGLLLGKLVNRNIRKELGRYAIGDVVMPRYSLESLPDLGLTMQLADRHQDVRQPLLDVVRLLCESGANLISLACNTTPYFADDIRSVTDEYQARFVSMPEEVERWLKDGGVDTVEFIAAKTVAKLDEWSAYREPLDGISVHTLDESTLDRIDELAYNVKTADATPTDLSRLSNIIRTFEPDSVVLFALTEISQLLALRKAGHTDRLKVVDTMDIYARAIASRYLGRPVEGTVTN